MGTRGREIVGMKDKDMVTYNLALTILQQEVENEEDLQALQEDLELMVGRGSK